MILIALVAPTFQLIGLEAISVGRALLFLLAFLFIAIGIVDTHQLAKYLSRTHQIAAILLLNTILTIVFIEIVAIVGWNAFIRSVPEENLIAQGRVMPYFDTVDWGEQYWLEFEESSTEIYAPFVVWKREAYSGEVINVDERGIRQTPGATCTEDAFTVFAFGGSTLWGVGAPDSMTIPAYLQQELESVHDVVCVINFGELGYNSTQEVIRLMLELQVSNVPDLVIFYDGLNDIYASYQNGAAGLHQNLSVIAARFEKQPPMHPLIRWLRGTYTMRLLSVILAKSPEYEFSDEQTTHVNNLADEILAVYAHNRQFVESLARTYDFEYVFFWQPILTSTEKPLDEEEQKIIGDLTPTLLLLYGTTYTGAEQITDEHFYNIADCLDQETIHLWFDPAHIIPPGNEVVAGCMFEIITDQDVTE